jgi:tRNA(His) guanylyltransferase
MKPVDLETRMRVFESAHDHSVLPGLFVVVRLDGRGFTRLTKDFMSSTRPSTTASGIT